MSNLKELKDLKVEEDIAIAAMQVYKEACDTHASSPAKSQRLIAQALALQVLATLAA